MDGWDWGIKWDGTPGRAALDLIDPGQNVRFNTTATLANSKDRRRLVRDAARQLHHEGVELDVDALEARLGKRWAEWTQDQARREAEAGPPAPPPVPDAGEMHFTDVGNGKRFVRDHGANFRHCFPWRRDLVWDGKRWREDDAGLAERWAKDTVLALYAEAAGESVGGRRQGLVEHALKSEDMRRVRAMLLAARSEPGVPVLPARLDRNPMLLCCVNGTVDLATGQLLPHRREDYVTKLCPVAYHAGAGCPLWERTLRTILAKKDDLLAYFQRLLGYGITGDTREQVLPILWGTGSNGKSLVFTTLLELLGGDYAMKATRDLFMALKNDKHPTLIADLFGKRLVACIETEQGGRLDEGLVKELTGSDPLKGRRMRQDYWQFDPTHKCFLATNHQPEIRGTDHAIWRRVQLVPFTVRFWDPDKGESGPDELRADKTLPVRLRAEYPGILAWLVRGCLQWQEHGLKAPPDVVAATKDYRGDQDVLARFLAERCVQSEDTTVRERANRLYQAYTSWCESTRESAFSFRVFGTAVSERGIQKLTSNGVWYLGVALQESRNTGRPEGRQPGEDDPE